MIEHSSILEFAARTLIFLLPSLAASIIWWRDYQKQETERVKIKAKESSAGESAIQELRDEIKDLKEDNEQLIKQNREMKDDILEIKREFLQYLKSKIKD